MHDPVLDRKLENCRKLQQCWQKFHQYLQAAIHGKEFTPQEESDFLKLKSQIAILHDSLMESIEKGNRESASTAQAIISIVENSITLRQLKRLTAAELKRMELQWHESYLLVNESIGILQEQVDTLEQISKFQHDVKNARIRAGKMASRTIHDKRVQYSVVFAVIVGVLVGLPSMGVFSYDILMENEITKKGYLLARTGFRATIWGSLPFLTWESYQGTDSSHSGGARKPMPGGYNPVNVGVDVEDYKQRFLYKEWPDLENLDLRNMVEENAEEVVAEKYTKGNREITLLLVMFETNAQAKEALNIVEQWQANIPEGSQAAQVESNYDYGSYNNVFWGMNSADSNLLPPVEKTLQGEKIRE